MDHYPKVYLSHSKLDYGPLRIIRIGDLYDIPTSGVFTTSGNTVSQTVSNFYDVVGRIKNICTLKGNPSQSLTPAIL